jgi:hypothetical protein
MNLPCVFSWHESYARHNAEQIGGGSYSWFTPRLLRRVGKRLTTVTGPLKILQRRRGAYFLWKAPRALASRQWLTVLGLQ